MTEVSVRMGTLERHGYDTNLYNNILMLAGILPASANESAHFDMLNRSLATSVRYRVTDAEETRLFDEGSSIVGGLANYVRTSEQAR
jgi:hypothetical protein